VRQIQKARMTRNRHPQSQLTSSGTGVRVRGSAREIAQKYEGLSSEARFAGDTMTAELHAQYAEHYRRVAAAQQPVVP
jgi:hypothetical protein